LERNHKTGGAEEVLWSKGPQRRRQRRPPGGCPPAGRWSPGSSPSPRRTARTATWWPGTVGTWGREEATRIPNKMRRSCGPYPLFLHDLRHVRPRYCNYVCVSCILGIYAWGRVYVMYVLSGREKTIGKNRPLRKFFVALNVGSSHIYYPSRDFYVSKKVLQTEKWEVWFARHNDRPQ